MPSTKFHGCYVVPPGQTDNYDWAKSQLWQFFFIEDHKTNHASSSQDVVCSVLCVLLRPKTFGNATEIQGPLNFLF